jgi:hypothetical protein
MNEIQSEWYYFILPLVTLPTLILWATFIKFVVPKWFGALEEG